MTRKLCLHGVSIAHPETFAADVAKRLKLTLKQGKLKEKEYGENLTVRYRRGKLVRDTFLPYKVRTMEGILLADSHLSDLMDVEFRYKRGSEKAVLAAVRKLLSGPDSFVVAERHAGKTLSSHGWRRREAPGHAAVSFLAGICHWTALASAV